MRMTTTQLPSFGEILEKAVRLHSGQAFAIFQDRRDLMWGDQWRKRLDSAIGIATFFIPIITPSFFQSSECRRELARFLSHEQALRREDLVLPVYYITARELSPQVVGERDVVASHILARQYVDWRKLRVQDWASVSMREAIAALADRLTLTLWSTSTADEAQASQSPTDWASARDVNNTDRTQPLGNGQPLSRYVIGDPGLAYSRVIANIVADSAVPPDATVDGGRAGALEVRAASVRGLSHQHSGLPRQDDYALSITRNEQWLVAAVADGVSSGELSHIGARLACRKIITSLAEALDGGADPEDIDWNSIHEECSQTILARGREIVRPNMGGEPPAQEILAAMATTLVAGMVSCHPNVDGRHHTVVSRVGDPSAAVLNEFGTWDSVTRVSVSTEVAHVTDVLPMAIRSPEIVSTYIRPGDALVLMSDGLGEGQGEVGAFFAESWRRPPDRFEFASQIAFARRSFDDDRTAIAIWPQRSE